MDKKNLLKQFESQIENDIATMKKAAIEAHEAATHTESKAEDQYDTRGLEAAYLAEAQSKRATELNELLVLFQNIDLLPFKEDSKIASTAVVELRCDSQNLYYFLMPKGGGMQTRFEGKLIQVITPQSPIGSALLGQSVGGEVSVPIKGAIRDYEVMAVW